MRLALIRDGLVVNVIEAEDDFEPGDGAQAIPAENAGPGWSYADGLFMPPAPHVPPPPESVERWQAKAVLRLMPGATPGTSKLDEADALVAALGDPVVAAFWDSATIIRRDSETLLRLAEAINISTEQLDELFRRAAAIAL